MAFVLALKPGRIRITRKTNQDEKGKEKPKQSQIASWAGKKLGFWVECTEKWHQRRLSQVAVALNANAGSFTDEKTKAQVRPLLFALLSHTLLKLHLPTFCQLTRKASILTYKS